MIILFFTAICALAWAAEAKKRTTMSKKSNQKDATGQGLNYSNLEKDELKSCEGQLKYLAKNTGYAGMKEEYMRRLAQIRAAKEKLG